MRRAAPRALAALPLAFALVVACGEDAPGGASPDAALEGGATVLPDGATVLADGAVVPTDGPEVVTFDAGTGQGDADAAVDEDAAPDAPAPPTCRVQSFNPNAANFRCAAAPNTLTGAGTFPLGTYNLNRWWNGASCYAIGSGELYVENGATYFRYLVMTRPDLNAAPVTATGTWRFDVVNGQLVRTEVCDAARLGRVTTGAYQANVAGFVANDGTPATLQQGWAKL